MGAVLTAPLAVRSWRATVHVVTGFPLALVGTVAVTGLAVATAGLAVTAVLGVFAGLGWLACVRGMASVQRSRFAAVLGVQIEAPPTVTGTTAWQRLLLALRTPSVWRQFGYHVLALPLNALGFVLVVAAWSAGLLCLTIFAHTWWLPEVNVYGWDLRSTSTLLTITFVGLASVYLAPWLARAMAAVDTVLARALLGPSRLENALTSRTRVLDAADLERRRIERDLHDGTQQRLTSLAMKLGIARVTLTDLPPPALDVLAEAHDEAKLALTELRDFVRGLHPAVLVDRGLDAALSGITARSPVPVRLRVDIARRPSSTIEAVAYFVVSEALANVTKHSGASAVSVVVKRKGDRLHVLVEDNGRGGADPEGGTGLRGLSRRVGSVDGTLRVDSPDGGPTRVVVELPCES